MPAGAGRVRHVVTVADIPTEDEEHARRRWYVFMAALGASPEILVCGMSLPQSVTIRHDGTRLVAVAEAIVPEGS